MVDFASHAPGTPSWVDLMSPDIDASKAFYSGLFGWDSEDQLDDQGNRIYVMFSVDGKSVAGMGGQPPGMQDMPPIWNTYVTVADVAATADAVTAAGGTVVMAPMQVMEAGEMAVFADPAGAGFMVWKPNQHIGIEVGNEPNTLCWNELMSRDIGASTEFFASVFGWEYEEMDMGDPAGPYRVIAGGDHGGLGAMMAMPAEVPAEVPSHWAVYFMVADIDATIEAATGSGATVAAGPMPIPQVGTMATVIDPQGGAFSLMQPAAG